MFISYLAYLALVPLALVESGAPKFNDGGVNLGHQKGFFEGDLLLTPKNRNAVFKAKRWTNGIVPYFIDPESIRDEYTPEHLKLIDEAMRAIEKHTCVRFVPYKNESKYTSFLKIGSGSACFSNSVGMAAGQNYVSLNFESCMVHRIVIHELFHAIGLHHEQSRYDRDQFLTINYKRLPNNGTDANSRFQFRIVPETESTFYGIPYNYASVMHYDAWAFGDNSPGALVMEPKNLGMLAIMGYASTANETDYEKVRRLYDCNGKYPVVPPAQIPCVDEDKWFDCNETYDYCDKDSTVIHNCRKTCGYCEWGKTPLKKQRPCKDWRPDCDYFANQCETAHWLARKCPVTCGKCKAGTMEIVPEAPGAGPMEEPITTTGKPPGRPGCQDEITYCNDYKHECSLGESTARVCRYTCGLC